jgi:hypothetical protein
MKNKIVFNLISIFMIVSAAIIINISSAADAFALSLCDGCPLQEVCSDTTGSVEILSCDNNAAPGAPAQMNNAAQLINEETAAETQETVITPGATLEASMPASATQEAAITSNAATHEAVVTPAVGQAAQSTEFAALTAYQTTGEIFLIITLKGDNALLEKFSRIITDKYAIKENKGDGCELIMATAEEFTIKISKETEKDKLDFMKSQGVKIYK